MARWQLKRGFSHDQPRRSVLLLISAALVVCAAGLIWLVLSGSSPKASPASAGASTATSPAAARAVLSATNQVTAAGTTMSRGLSGMRSLPTVALVSAVVDPYGASLGRYVTALSAASLGRGAAQSRTSVVTQVEQIESLVTNLATTPSGQLGGWIDNFYLQTAQLQSAIEDLEAALGHSPAA